jgi:hypothetical protein
MVLLISSHIAYFDFYLVKQACDIIGLFYWDLANKFGRYLNAKVLVVGWSQNAAFDLVATGEKKPV